MDEIAVSGESEVACLEGEWRKNLDTWEKSGSSVAAWCRSQGIGYQRFMYWKRKLSPAGEIEASGRFVELADRPVSGIELEVGGVRIRVHGDFDGVAFVKAVRLLRTA
jgi:hypothetical protein